MKKIIENWYSSKAREEGLIEVDHTHTKSIENLLLGQKVIAVDDDHMELDNGTVIRVIPNDGGCACSAGDYWLESLVECDNIITHVEVDCETVGDDKYEPDLSYRIYVVAEDTRINLLDIRGNDGNGYYGTGYRMMVREA